MYRLLQPSSSSHLLDLGLFGTAIAKRRPLWQMNLLNASELAAYSQKRGVSFFEKEDIIRLWQLGFLQADLIESGHELQETGLVKQDNDEYDLYIYSDERHLAVHPNGWDEEVANLVSLLSDAHPLFHPFRYYVLYQLERNLSRISIIGERPFPLRHFAAPDLSWFKAWSSSADFVETITSWNDISALITFTEPYMYERVFGSPGLDMYWMSRGGWQELYNQIEQLGQEIIHCYQIIGIERLQVIYQELCEAAHKLDPNENIHTLICLGEGQIRLKLEGRLGGAIHLRSMAEILRRAIEETFPKQLPEEDVGRFGVRPGVGDYKEALYGSKRVLDGDRFVANEFLKHLGLNFGFRLHWYVEGKTEYGALRRYFQRFKITEIDVVDLHGEVVQRGHRGIAFRESLRSDIQMEVYSIVSIDGDVPENARVVRKAAEDDEICGAFYIFTQDFEFANFEVWELEEVLWEIAKENGVSLDDREKLHNAIQDSANAEVLLRNAKRSLPSPLAHVAKNILWGERLMDYAINHHFKGTLKRPILEAMDQAIFWTRTPNLESYKNTRRTYRVDKGTGKLVKRSL